MSSMPLHVGVDISSIPYNRGVSRYTANLVRALHKQKEKIVLRLIGASGRQQHVLRTFAREELPGVPSKILPYPVKIMEIVWNRLHLLPPELFMGKLDVFHSWELQPPTDHAALVSTIHDLAMLRYPKTADPYVLAMHERSWKHLKKEAKAIIAVSESTKKDIIELLQIEPERIHVVYEALPSEARLNLTSTRRKELVSRFGFTKPYIFFVGTLEPRKNVHRLISAWRMLKKDCDLVLAGAAGWEALKNEDGLHIVGSVSNDELAALHSTAIVLAYPSLYEGFGLPILDGFYHNIPVVTSNVSSMSEIAGDAAVLVNPHEVESIKEGIETAIKHRVSYVAKGKQRLKLFSSWDKVAVQTIEVYEKAHELKVQKARV